MAARTKPQAKDDAGQFTETWFWERKDGQGNVIERMPIVYIDPRTAYAEPPPLAWHEYRYVKAMLVVAGVLLLAIAGLMVWLALAAV
jgi:hypothetical protein